MKFNYVHRGHPQHEIPKSGQVRYVCYPELRRRGYGSGTYFKEKETNLQEYKSVNVCKQVFPGVHRNNGT